MQLFQDEHVKEWYTEVVCNGFQVIGGLGSIDYEVGCEVFRAATT